MQTLKLTIAEQLAEKLRTLNPDGAPAAADLADMFEYPPDPKMGDLALPCFKLSRTLRRAPVQIAAALCECLTGLDYVEHAEAVNG
ncbi:MAG: arginine--tRNA ligase, partial [Clostridia bacterium]|nr:arginine--tRNA ligase [Clostridia bacterium]